MATWPSGGISVPRARTGATGATTTKLGRINLITPEKVLQGVREIEAGISFSLSLPLDYPGGSAMNQRRYPPILKPTEDLAHTPDVFYNIVAKESISPSYIDVWSDDYVTLWLQYSTQWGRPGPPGRVVPTRWARASRKPCTTTVTAPGTDIVGPQPDAKGDGSGSTSFGKHLGLEHMAAHGTQGRGVLIDIAHHLDHTEDWRPVRYQELKRMMDADGVVIESGDMVLLHTGFATKILEWGKNPDASRIQAMYPYLDGDDPEILQMDHRLRDVGPHRGQLRGRGLVGQPARTAFPDPRSTTCVCSSWAFRSVSSGTSTTWPGGCASTTGRVSC